MIRTEGVRKQMVEVHWKARLRPSEPTLTCLHGYQGLGVTSPRSASLRDETPFERSCGCLEKMIKITTGGPKNDPLL